MRTKFRDLEGFVEYLTIGDRVLIDRNISSGGENVLNQAYQYRQQSANKINVIPKKTIPINTAISFGDSIKSGIANF